MLTGYFTLFYIYKKINNTIFLSRYQKSQKSIKFVPAEKRVYK